MEEFFDIEIVFILNWIVWNRTVNMYKKIDLALDNLQWLMCHKTKPNQTKQSVYKSYI